MRKIAKRKKTAREFSLFRIIWSKIIATNIWLFKHPRSSIIFVFLLIGIFGWYSAWPQRVSEVCTKFIDEIMISAGLEVQHIYLEGRRYAPSKDLQQALAIEQGKPILRSDLPEIKSRAEEIPWVREAIVERLFPSTLSIHIFEREPVALWQYQGKIHALDADGVAIEIENVMPFANLPLLVGKDVPAHAAHLRGVISAEPSLAPLVASAIRVGERRWNIRLHNGVEILLPEEDIERAWRFLATMQAEGGILDTKIKSIDLRLADKVYISK
jgi:cell division protein FtsQ